MKQLKKYFVQFFILLVTAAAFSDNVLGQRFIHPGILHSKADLERMRNAIMLNKSLCGRGIAFLSKMKHRNTLIGCKARLKR